VISTDLTAAERKAYESNIWKSYVFTFLHSFQLWWPIWVIYLTDERGYSLTQVSVLEALFWVVIVLAEVPTGVVADRFGRKVSLVASSAFTGVAILVFGVAGNYPIVLLSYIVWGVGLTFQSGADSALVYESLKAVGREQDYQQVAGRGWGLFSLGVTLGLLAGAPIAAATNLSTPILLSAGITFAGLFVAASMKEPAVPHEERRLPYGDLLRGSIRTAWRTPKVRTMLVLGAILLAAPNVSVVFSQPFLDEHGVALSTFGLWQAPTRLASMAASLIAYRVSGTFGFRKTVLGAFVVLSGAYFVLGSWDSVYAFAGIGAALVILSMLLPIISDYVNQRIPNAQRATILSFRQLGTSVTIASIQPIQGLIADAWSLQAVFLATAAFLVVAVPLALIAWLRADSRPEEHEAGSKVAELPSG
jgi:MFS family permease